MCALPDQMLAFFGSTAARDANMRQSRLCPACIACFRRVRKVPSDQLRRPWPDCFFGRAGFFGCLLNAASANSR
jgi:hypothetical protein